MGIRTLNQLKIKILQKLVDTPLNLKGLVIQEIIIPSVQYIRDTEHMQE